MILDTNNVMPMKIFTRHRLPHKSVANPAHSVVNIATAIKPRAW
jgi:hypothetical protein